MFGFSLFELTIVWVVVIFLCRVRFPQIRDRSGRRITILSAEHLHALVSTHRPASSEFPRAGKLLITALVGALAALLVDALMPK